MLTESEVESRLHDELTVAVAAITPDHEFMRSALSHRPRHPWSRPRLALGAIPIAAGLAVALLVFVAPTTAIHQVQNRPAFLTVKLLGHPVRLPMGDRALSSSDSSCRAWVAATQGTIINWAMPAAVDDAGIPDATSAGQSNVVSAPDGEQSCIQSSISGAYALPPGIAATSPLVPDGNGASPTTVDGDYAETVPTSVQATSPDGSSSTTQGTLLYVRVPASNGQFQLVTVIGWAMPTTEVVALTSSALNASNTATTGSTS
jgi:hypothetical protein